MPDAARIKVLAVEKARQLGARDVRVAPAFVDARSRERMRAAFKRGDLQSWGYSDEYARRACDPHDLLREARSVVCIAMSYATAEPDGYQPLHGRVSNYAWSSDYHVRVHALLAGVARTIDEAAGAAGHGGCMRHATVSRACVCGTGRPWLDWKAHESHLAVARLVRLFGRDRHERRTAAGRAALEELRRVRQVH